jgi:hypothetical protein
VAFRGMDLASEITHDQGEYDYWAMALPRQAAEPVAETCPHYGGTDLSTCGICTGHDG